MARGNPYHAPTQILGDQACKTSSLYTEDDAEGRDALASVGAGPSMFEAVGQKGAQLLELEQRQEGVKAEAAVERQEASAAITELLAWRNKIVLPRVRLAFLHDPRLRYFRTGKLQSVRPATVLRETGFLVDALKRYQHLPELSLRGITDEIIAQGVQLVERARTEDVEAEHAIADQRVISERVYDLEDEVGSLLAEIEACAGVVFEAGSARWKRYRMNVIRTYVKEHTADPTATVDPA